MGGTRTTIRWPAVRGRPADRDLDGGARLRQTHLENRRRVLVLTEASTRLSAVVLGRASLPARKPLYGTRVAGVGDGPVEGGPDPPVVSLPIPGLRA